MQWNSFCFERIKFQVEYFGDGSLAAQLSLDAFLKIKSKVLTYNFLMTALLKSFAHSILTLLIKKTCPFCLFWWFGLPFFLTFACLLFTISIDIFARPLSGNGIKVLHLEIAKHKGFFVYGNLIVILCEIFELFFQNTLKIKSQ